MAPSHNQGPPPPRLALAAKSAAAAPAPLTPPSRADVVKWVGGYLTLYLTQTHINKWATGEWVYPIIEVGSDDVAHTDPVS